MNDVVVVDTTPLICLAGVELLDLLPQLYATILVPDAVLAEYAVGARAGDPPIAAQAWARVHAVQIDSPLLAVVDKGEVAVISLALQVGATRVLLDERFARRVATQHELVVSGTLGVLLAAKEQGFVSSLTLVIDAMLAQGRYISARVRVEALRIAGE